MRHFEVFAWWFFLGKSALILVHIRGVEYLNQRHRFQSTNFCEICAKVLCWKSDFWWVTCLSIKLNGLANFYDNAAGLLISESVPFLNLMASDSILSHALSFRGILPPNECRPVTKNEIWKFLCIPFIGKLFSFHQKFKHEWKGQNYVMNKEWPILRQGKNRP